MSTLTKKKGGAVRVTAKKSSSVRRDEYNQPRQNHWNRLDNATLETIFARLDIADLFYCQKVCWRWKQIIRYSPTIVATRKELFPIPRQQQPWFAMFNPKSSSVLRGSYTGLVFDMEIRDWRPIDLLLPTRKFVSPNTRITPIAASGPYICFICEVVNNSDSPIGTNPETGNYRYLPSKRELVNYHSGFLIVTNPVTGNYRYLPRLETFGHIWGITMYATNSGSKSNYKVFVIFGDWPYNLVVKVYSSSMLLEDECEQQDVVARSWMDLPVKNVSSKDVYEEGRIFLGEPYEVLDGVATIGNEGQILLNYLHERSGRLICFDTQRGCCNLSEETEIFNCLWEAYDLVECAGLVFALIIEGGELKTFTFDHKTEEWQPVYELTIAVRDSHFWKSEFTRMGVHCSDLDSDYTGLMDVHCSSHGDYIMVCLNFETLSSARFNKYLMINTKKLTYVHLPEYVRVYGRSCNPTLAYSFKPDIQAKV